MERWLSLQKLLDLRNNSKHIRELSGGMKRRVSLALALIHSPKLLVLDEPTVGLDPLLRENIWQYLQNLATNSGTTILITTHYTDEARLANTIGVMRNGRLITEQAPYHVLENSDCVTLDEAILKLCQRDQAQLKKLSLSPNGMKTKSIFKSNWHRKLSESESFSEDLKQNKRVEGQHFRLLDVDTGPSILSDKSRASGRSGIYKSYRKVYGFTAVMILTLLRFPAFVAFMLFMPTLQGSLTLVTLGSKMKDMHIGVVDNEFLTSSWNTMCDSPQQFSNSCDFSALSCKFLNGLRSVDFFILDSYETEDEARSQVHLGNSWGYLMFPPNYSEHQINRMAARSYAFPEDIEGSVVHVHLDNSQYVANYFLLKELFEAYFKFVQNLLVSCKIGDPRNVIQMHYHEPVYGTNGHDLTYVLPGVIICSVEMLIICITSFVFIADLKQGTLERARVAGLSLFEIMLSHVITQQVFVAFQTLIWTLVTHYVFDIQIRGSYYLYVAFCILGGLFGALNGLVCGIIFRNEVTVLIVGVFLLPTFLLYGDVIFPFESMPKVCQFLAKFMPVTLPTEALRSIVVRGVSISHPLVWPGFVAWVVWGIVLAVVFPIVWKLLYK